MKKPYYLTIIAIGTLALSGCVHVAESDYSNTEEVAANTERALLACGGPGTVAEVTDDGFECKTETDD